MGHAGSSRPRGPGPRRRTLATRTGQSDLAGVLHAVAAQVRAGVPPGAAWAAVLGSPVDRQVPEVDVVVAAVGGTREQRARVRAVVAGAHVAAETGAPLADVLEHLADAAAADAEQAGELAAALAGPRATARVLTSLPVLGLLVGSAMGARPWEVLTDGGLGSVLGAVGVALVVAGRAWVDALLRRAGAP
ncbi:type II secretion system F family protein [Cellulomonas sp. Sa3CUA2]|uniref:Type II secretion system F family protein n=1 Tax=Cellulomonas avistercoris TaxID=2762242 RepID=A0ABR8QH35_9CELL|nr:type II secretion system F family protein [Cellulomonas avistercoris]